MGGQSVRLRTENIHEYRLKCNTVAQITLDDDFNVRKKTIPPATKCSLRQSLLWRHYSYYQILSLVCLRNLNHSITPALVSPNGKAIQTPVSPQPKTKPQRYPTGKDIIK